VSFQIRAATSADAPGIRRLFEKVFGTALTQEEWRWKFELGPDGWYGVVGVVDGEIVGNYSGWGMQFLLDGSPRLLYSVGDVATNPGVRGLGGRRSVYRAMTEAFYEAVERAGVPFCFGFPNSRALRVSERIVGSRTLFPIRLVEVPVDAFPPPPPDAGTGDSVDESFDSLWEAARRGLSHAAVRDRARVNWRFHARPNRYYPMVWRKQGGAMTAWAALSVTGQSATVVDFLSGEPDGRDFPALLAVAAEEARRLGARHLVFWSSPGGPGRAAIEGLSGQRRDADFPMIVRVFDDGAVRRFAENLQLVPSLYDLT
jgi:hypothetical protein